MTNPFYQLAPIGSSIHDKTTVVYFDPSIDDPTATLEDIRKLRTIRERTNLVKYVNQYTSAIKDTNFDSAFKALKEMVFNNGPVYTTLLETAIETINIASTKIVNTVFKAAEPSMDGETMVALTRLMVESPKSNAYDTYLRKIGFDPIKDDKTRLTLTGLPPYYKKLSDCRRRYWLYLPFLHNQGERELYKVFKEIPLESADEPKAKILNDILG